MNLLLGGRPVRHSSIVCPHLGVWFIDIWSTTNLLVRWEAAEGGKRELHALVPLPGMARGLFGNVENACMFVCVCGG